MRIRPNMNPMHAEIHREMPVACVADPSSSRIPMAPTNLFMFIKLPSELRNSIYEEVTHLKDERVDGMYVDHDPTHFTTLQNLSRVNHQVRNEVRPFLERECHIRIRWGGVDFLGRRVKLLQQVHPDWLFPPFAKQVKDWRITIELNDNVLEHNQNQIANIFLTGKYLKDNGIWLKNLKIEIHCPCDITDPRKRDKGFGLAVYMLDRFHQDSTGVINGTYSGRVKNDIDKISLYFDGLHFRDPNTPEQVLDDELSINGSTTQATDLAPSWID